MNRPQNAGELSRVKAHEANSDWPTQLEITAYWSKDGSRKGRRRSVEIAADRFFGTGAFGAPMSGGEIIGMVEKLRREGPKV